MELTYDEIMDILGTKYFPSQKTGFTLPPGIYEISDIKKKLQFFLPDFVKVKITIDDIRLKSDLNFNLILIFTKKPFFNTLLGFVGSHSSPLRDIKGFVSSITGTYGSEKPTNVTGIDKNQLKSDCNNGSVVKGVREPILYSFALSEPPGHKI